jgi:hypothetical protein
MSAAHKLAVTAETALKQLKHHVRGAEDTQACMEAIMVVEILRNKYADEEPEPKPHRHGD